ncbi:hypothetical protein ABFX02_08G170600 [Erythranthe guttata]
MTSENEPAKLLLPYLQRADELQKHEPLVAYYCRLYAMERGLKFPQKERTKTTNALLVSLIKQLEKDKKSLQLGPDDHLHVEGFALNVFTKADKQDRAGRSDLTTAKTFYAASIFFEILYQFGELQPDLEQKQKYAAWKAVDIRRALKEGRTPNPGPPGSEKDYGDEYDLEPVGPNSSRVDPSTTTAPDSDQMYGDNVTFQNLTDISPQSSDITPPNISTPRNNPIDDYPSDSFHQPSPQNHPFQNYPNYKSDPNFTESYLPTAPSHVPSYYQGSDPPYSNLPPPNTSQFVSVARSGNVLEASSPSTTRKYEYDSSYEPSPEQISEAQKAARFAVGALAFDDVCVAVDHLKKSLELLTKPPVGK